VGGEVGGDAGVPGGFAVPATFGRVIVEGFDIDELSLEYGSELGPGDVDAPMFVKPSSQLDRPVCRWIEVVGRARGRRSV
jgi:hypothetical protein